MAPLSEVCCAGCCAILLVEDESTLRLPMQDFLGGKGARVVAVADGDEAKRELARREFDMVFTDIRLPGADGFEVLTRAQLQPSKPDVVMMTAYADVEAAVRALREGAYDFLVKPFRFAQLETILRRHCRERQVVRERDELKAELEGRFDPTHIVACSRAMQAVVELVRRVAPTQASVVFSGETGTGKEVLAELLHRLSPRSEGRLVKVNCAAIPDTLLESELFGHERGAFTGAVARRRGRFEMAHGGTLFLDEIGDLSLAAQAKVLRAIQERQFERVGGEIPISVDVRFVAASHRDLAKMVKEGTFREDLYYRLAVHTVEVPPLRERALDLGPLIGQLVQRTAVRDRRKPPAVPEDLVRRLSGYPFPGNIRELSNLIERACSLCDGEILQARHFPSGVLSSAEGLPLAVANAPLAPLAEASARFEEHYIAQVLARTGGRRAEAAQLLGISRKTLWARLSAHGGADEHADPEDLAGFDESTASDG
ncbi:MAG: sigma-54-dependent Fis family transcriptional regulator [Deltaproteobacteria bacterium]|nr:sigma-54-dependent Fis family transcriptional regulator [Deltaproteobacteria bacterium]